MADLSGLVIAAAFITIGCYMSFVVGAYVWGFAFALLGGYVILFGD